MKELWLVLKTALQAAAWRRVPTPPSVTLRTVLIWIVVAMAAEAARQYVDIDEAASFSFYGINTIIAETAVSAAIGLLFFSIEQSGALALLFALNALAAGAAVTAISFPALVVPVVFVVPGIAYFSRNRTAVFWKLFALAGVIELALIAARQLPEPVVNGMVSAAAKLVLMMVLLVWWVGAIAAIFRGSAGIYRRPTFRAIGFGVVSILAIMASPSFPTFMGRDSDPATYNLWELARASLAPAAEEPAAPDGTDGIELSQPLLLEAEVRKLLPERRGSTDVYAIGIAGWSDQDVFVKELDGGLAALNNAIGLDRGTIRLVNHFDMTEKSPIANQTNFASAVHSIAKLMDKDDDILLIFITSHGSPRGAALRLSGVFNSRLAPDHVATVLDREGIKNRLIIVSACFSGVFVDRLASPDSIVLTAADANSPSFGCSNERDWTYFGDAMFNQNLAAGVSLQDAFNTAKMKISQWEARDSVSPSNPQGFFGSRLAAKLRAKSGADNLHHALANEH